MFTEDEHNEMLEHYGYKTTSRVVALRTLNTAIKPTEADLAGEGTFTARVIEAYQRIYPKATESQVQQLISLTLYTVNTFNIRKLNGWGGPAPQTIAELAEEFNKQTESEG